MAIMRFIEKLNAAWISQQSLLCVGFDPVPEKIPLEFMDRSDSLFAFCKAIADATHDLVCAFKPQIAYFSSSGSENQLQELCSYLRKTYPNIPVILDAKRGDIGSTAEQYAHEAFERYGADAVTVSPYMGFDSISPYLEWKERGIIILCRTSNPGGADLQCLNVNGIPLYQHVATLVAEKWNCNHQCSLVVGATFPDELAVVRKQVGDLPLLVPGIGAQGGDIRACIEAGSTANGCGLMLNSSRAILYAIPSQDENFAQAARRVAKQTRDTINRYRNV